MATKNEKMFGSVTGGILGGIITNNWARKNERVEKKDVFWYTLGGIILGIILGYGTSCLIGSPNNTVNYTHYYKGKRVYEGITYVDRFNRRMAEHKANGKVFTNVIKDKPKPRVDALKLEKKRILKYKPINNIQHNS